MEFSNLRVGKYLPLDMDRDEVSSINNKICLRCVFFQYRKKKSQILVHVLIQTDITFKILKTYMRFCIFLQMKDCTFQLYRLETSSRCQI